MKSKIIKLFLKIFSGIVILSTIATFIMFSLTYKSKLNKIKDTERYNIKSSSRVISRIINSITSDALFLSHIPYTRNDIITKDTNYTFLEFSRSKKIYDQVRYLDSKGDEILRINWNNGNPKLVAPKELQNKKGRYYFDDTYALSKDQVFISPLDLNIEKGQIETPFKPMLRIGTPVFDNENNKKGIILLNYFGKDLIEELKKNLTDSQSNFQLLNQNGYWLSSDKSEDEWGFMFSDKNETTFANRFSYEIWNIIKSKNSGQINSKFGLFTFETIYPLNISTESKYALSSNQERIEWQSYKWKIISYLPNEDIQNINRHIGQTYFFPWLIFVVLNGMISYLLAKSIIKRKIAEQGRIDAEKKYHILFEEAGESIIVTRKEDTIMVNNKSESLFGYSKEELLNTPIETLIHPDDREYLLNKKIKQCSEDISSMVFEAKILTKFGDIKWVEIRSSKLNLYSDSVILYFFIDITGRKKVEAKLKELATTDPLTGVYNRRYFNENLEKEIKKSKRINYDLAVIMIDLDHFKDINDTYGHHVGDQIIKKFIKICSLEIRSVDTIGRLGGEEFAIILPNCSETIGLNCAERIRISAQNSILKLDKGEQVKFSASFGVALFEKNDDAESILKKADKALYNAKETGRNKTVLYSKIRKG